MSPIIPGCILRIAGHASTSVGSQVLIVGYIPVMVGLIVPAFAPGGLDVPQAQGRRR